MQATIVLFKNETHVQFFDPDSKNHIINHPSHWTTADALVNIFKMSSAMNLNQVDYYSEVNELGEHIQCFFMEG